jgi:hypothetical protein
VEKLASLNPDMLTSGHGPPMRGERLRCDLEYLATHFTREMSRRGRYLLHPAPQGDPVAMMQESRRSTSAVGTWAASAAIAAGLWWMWRTRRRAA